MTVSSKPLREQVALSLPMLVAFISVSGIGKILKRIRSTQVSVVFYFWNIWHWLINAVITSYNCNFTAQNNANPATHVFVASPDIVSTLFFAGQLIFNLVTNELIGSDGKLFKFEDLSSHELPSCGYNTGQDTFQAPLKDYAVVQVAVSPAFECLDPKIEKVVDIAVDYDNSISDGIIAESLFKLKSVFIKNSSTYMGNASQVSDGAVAILLAYHSIATKLSLPIIGKFVWGGERGADRHTVSYKRWYWGA